MANQRSDQIFEKSLEISKICHSGLLLYPELLPAPVTDSLSLLSNAAHSGGIVSKDALGNKKRAVKLVTIVMFSLSWLPIQLILLLK